MVEFHKTEIQKRLEEYTNTMCTCASTMLATQTQVNQLEAGQLPWLYYYNSIRHFYIAVRHIVGMQKSQTITKTMDVKFKPFTNRTIGNEDVV
jgi:hypothetical protein